MDMNLSQVRAVDTGEQLMQRRGEAARKAATILAQASTAQKTAALQNIADAVNDFRDDILAANQDEVDAARQERPQSFVDRLLLDDARIDSIVRSVREIAQLPDPIGAVMASWTRPNGLTIDRVRTPIGVIGIIYESRPNVTIDAAALCLMAANASILRPGSDSFNSCAALHRAVVAGLLAAGLPEAAVQMVPGADRAFVGQMLGGLAGNIDVIVPRGGKSLVERVQREARVPVFSHLDGICHVYVHDQANLAMAQRIIVNAKLRRVGICGAAECLLIDRGCVESHLQPLLKALLDAGCEVRGDAACQMADGRVVPAQENDWGHEYLDTIIAARVVEHMDDAIGHITHYGSGHTDAIISDDIGAAEYFMARVDSAIVVHNASTQFADGGEFGLGAEIGIATGRLHARGPVGVEQLTSFKYRLRGHGQIRD